MKLGASGHEERHAAFKINSLFGMMKAVESGLGIAGLPDYMGNEMSHVTKVLPDLKGPLADVYVMYSVELRNSKRIKVFKEFLVRKLAEDGLAKVA